MPGGRTGTSPTCWWRPSDPALAPEDWAAQAARIPGLDGLLSYAACALFTPARGMRMSVRGNPAARDTALTLSDLSRPRPKH